VAPSTADALDEPATTAGSQVIGDVKCTEGLQVGQNERRGEGKGS